MPAGGDCIRTLWVTVAFVSALLLPPARLGAQQTIFNVPSTDVLDRGKVYVEPVRRVEQTLVIKKSLPLRWGFWKKR